MRFSVIGTKTLPCIRAIRVFALALAPNNNFIIGHDLSTVIQLEDIGKTFSEQGITQPIEKILVNHQSNLVRLRLWVNPLENFNNLAQVKRMAIRVKAAGMKFLLDFHYSDTWADPGHQDIPKDWAGQDLSSLTKSVREYSQAVIAELVAQNTAPDMVQIGNEITNGMLYPLGKIEGSSQAGFQNFAQLLQAGIQGTRAGMPAGHAYEIMIHIDRGANAFVTQSFFERLEQAQISFDVIGLSYYPYWNGSLSSLRTSLDGLAKRFKKPIIITETAYPWTLKDFDNYPNIIGAGTTLPDAYSPSIEGQALFLRDLLSVIAQIPNNLGRGMIYWESAWLSGIPWKPQEGNAWDNQTLFSATGEALESLQAFHLR